MDDRFDDMNPGSELDDIDGYGEDFSGDAEPEGGLRGLVGKLYDAEDRRPTKAGWGVGAGALALVIGAGVMLASGGGGDDQDVETVASATTESAASSSTEAYVPGGSARGDKFSGGSSSVSGPSTGSSSAKTSDVFNIPGESGDSSGSGDDVFSIPDAKSTQGKSSSRQSSGGSSGPVTVTKTVTPPPKVVTKDGVTKTVTSKPEVRVETKTNTATVTKTQDRTVTPKPDPVQEPTDEAKPTSTKVSTPANTPESSVAPTGGASDPPVKAPEDPKPTDTTSGGTAGRDAAQDDSGAKSVTVNGKGLVAKRHSGAVDKVDSPLYLADQDGVFLVPDKDAAGVSKGSVVESGGRSYRVTEVRDSGFSKGNMSVETESVKDVLVIVSGSKTFVAEEV